MSRWYDISNFINAVGAPVADLWEAAARRDWRDASRALAEADRSEPKFLNRLLEYGVIPERVWDAIAEQGRPVEVEMSALPTAALSRDTWYKCRIRVL